MLAQLLPSTMPSSSSGLPSRAYLSQLNFSKYTLCSVRLSMIAELLPSPLFSKTIEIATESVSFLARISLSTRFAV
jgi:hypothetical protein